MMHQVKGMAQNKGVMLNPREERENAGSTSVIPSVFASKSFPAFHLRTKLCLTTAKLATCIPSKCMQRHNVFVLHFFLRNTFVSSLFVALIVEIDLKKYIPSRCSPHMCDDFY